MRCVRLNSSSPLSVSGSPGETNRQQSEAGEAGERLRVRYSYFVISERRNTEFSMANGTGGGIEDTDCLLKIEFCRDFGIWVTHLLLLFLFSPFLGK